MRPLIWGLLAVLFLIIQATLLPLIAINGIRPDLLLLVVVSSALLLGKEQGVGLGFFSGLLQDLASGNIFGLNVLAKIVTGYLAGAMERKVFKENILLPVLAVTLATVFNNFVMILTLIVLGYNPDLSAALVNILYLVIYNAIMAIPVHYLVSWIARHWIIDQSS
ncbi:MAG: rod shape-determining protein MreD [Negativicutes bacterium]|nr:rod shape-determining protein MreD [Negativicutes bacterium]